MVEVSKERKVGREVKERVAEIIANQLSLGSAISLWRLPGETRKNLIVNPEGVQWIADTSLEELGKGFLFSPFDGEKKKAFIKAAFCYTIENDEIAHVDILNPSIPETPPSYQSEDNRSPKFFTTDIPLVRHTDSDEYISLVKKSIQQIKAGNFEKLVPSRSKQIDLPENFDLLESFNQLCATYPNAFVSLVSSEETGTWMGASPELLVSVDEKLKFRTVAVAGTQTLQTNTDLKLVAWTQKEIEEQALVSRYIINCFKKIRLREFEEHGPRTWKAGNLLHLKTDFEVDMAATNFPQLGSVMLKLLHPTSAVCGMPREESISFLSNNEKFDRAFYSGYLGPVNYQNETHLFVNLRCMHWNEKSAILFAGAGVTSDSIPEKEWEETEMKMNTLLKVIRP